MATGVGVSLILSGGTAASGQLEASEVPLGVDHCVQAEPRTGKKPLQWATNMGEDRGPQAPSWPNS